MTSKFQPNFNKPRVQIIIKVFGSIQSVVLPQQLKGLYDTTEYNGFITKSGPGSVVGIATGYGLDGPGIESQGGARFSAPVQTVPGAHPASYTIGTGSFPGVKSGQGVTLTPSPPSDAVVMKE